MPSTKREIPNKLLVLVAGVVIAVFIAAWKAVPFLVNDASDPARRAEVLSAFFSALAFGGVIGAIIMQKRELELQREELEETRRVLGEQSRHLANQAATAQAQFVEGTLFEMIRLHHDIVASARFDEAEGRQVFISLAWRVRDQVTTYAQRSTYRDSIGLGMNRYREALEAFLPTYLGNLQEMVHFVGTSELSTKQKYRYMRLIRSQLSKPEIVLIFFSALSVEWRVLRAAIEKYGFFYSLNPSDLGGDEALKLYHDDAFLWWSPDNPISA